MKLEFVDGKVEYDGKVVGQMGIDGDTGRLYFVKWGPLFRKFDSYATSADIIEDIDVDRMLVVDSDTGKVYLFSIEDYREGELIKFNEDYQYILPRTEALQTWESLDEILA